MNAGNLPTTTIYAVYPSMAVPYTISSNRIVLPPPPPVLPMIYIPPGQTQNPAPQFFVEQATCPFGPHSPTSPVLYLPAQMVHHHPAQIFQHVPAPVVEQHPVPDYHDNESSMQVDQTDSLEHVSMQEISNEPPSIQKDVSAATTSSSEPPEAPETKNTTKHDSGPSNTNKWTCHTCALKLSSRTELDKHRQEIHADWGLSNEYGQRPSRKFNYLNRAHQVAYSAPPSFPCKLCHKTGNRREYLDAHLRQYHRVEIPYNATYRRLFY